MTNYFKVHCSNGFCGCEEEFLVKSDLEYVDCEDVLSVYAYSEPDSRFIDDDEFGYEEYQDNISIDWEQISKEKFNELIEWGWRVENWLP